MHVQLSKSLPAEPRPGGAGVCGAAAGSSFVPKAAEPHGQSQGPGGEPRWWPSCGQAAVGSCAVASAPRRLPSVLRGVGVACWPEVLYCTRS